MKKNLFALISLFVMCASVFAQQKSKYLVNVNADGVILDGYDAVAFFTDNKPVKGDKAITVNYHGATYLFASAEHAQMFTQNHEKYDVQFGGYCAYAATLGRTAPIDVNTFSIVDNRLVIQHNSRAVAGWNKDVKGNLSKADKYWPSIVNNDGKQIKTDEEKKFLVNTDKDGVILQGYDVVAYFTDNKAVKGDEKFSARYNGATYWFVSQAHADMFKDNSEKYAPQYGAFCGYAVSLNKLRPVEPTIFQIEDGRLILQHTQQAYDLFNKDTKGNTVLADKNWPTLVMKRAGKKVKFDKPAKPAAAENTTAKK
ncbi:MAG: YHS domain-containing (seleno)protein [Bacteroidia bacterium]